MADGEPITPDWRGKLKTGVRKGQNRQRGVLKKGNGKNGLGIGTSFWYCGPGRPRQAIICGRIEILQRGVLRIIQAG